MISRPSAGLLQPQNNMNSTAHYITEKKLFENARIFIAPTKARDVVTIVGSVLGGATMLTRAQAGIPLLAGGLFDAGTKKNPKNILRESLAGRGATLSFFSGGDRTGFSGSCMPEDAPFLLQMIVECLGEASFPEKEIAIERAQQLGRLEESKTETRVQAGNELTRLLYDDKHVNYIESDQSVQKYLKSVTRKQLLDFRTLLGKGGLVIAIAGDTTADNALKAIERSFGKLSDGTSEAPAHSKNTKKAAAEEKRIPIPEKANIDVFLGSVIPITRDDKAFLPFMTLSDMLGGGFAAHLMQTVRERDGLTYGISTAPTGFGKDMQGMFRIWSTFSPHLFEKGIHTIRKEIKTFFATGITQDSLIRKQDEMTGSYVIGLSTTVGLATMLHKIGIEEKSLSYIDEYLELIRALSVKDIQEVAALIPYTRLAITAAGTFAK
jgi:zinc protease